MKLALLRHAVTQWNLQKRVQGRIDQPLSPIGRRRIRALSLAPDYSAYRWFCSPLQRAKETLELLGVNDYRVDAALVEMSWGDWEGQVLKQLRRRLGDEMRANEARGIDFRPPGGESPREVQARLRAFLEQQAPGGENIAAVSHQGVIRCIYSIACGWDMRGESPVEFAWDSIHQFEFAGDGCLLDSYQAIPLVKI